MANMAVSTSAASRNLSHGTHWAYEDPPQFQSFSFENIDYPLWKHFMALNWTLPIWVSGLYVVVIFSLQRCMKHRAPFKVDWALALWNLGLAIFSIMGFCRISTELFAVLTSPNGFHRSVCSRYVSSNYSSVHNHME